jgi:GNAT superfamily N-acetyltransferase
VRNSLADPIHIRLFEPSDVSVVALTMLLHESYASLAALGLRYLATWQPDEITLERALSGECYVAIEKDRIVGTVVFKDPSRTCGCDWYDRPEVASFGQFAVLPELQGRGIGGALLDLCEQRAHETGAAELACDTAQPAEHLIRFYEKRGYRQIETVQWEETNYRSVILSKRINGGRNQ